MEQMEQMDKPNLQVAADNKIKIEKSVPLPMTSHRPSRYPWQKMEIGDSFAWPAELSAAGCYGAARDANREEILKNSPKRFKASIRGGGSRIWRVA